jgi:hypothetical protein
MSSARLNPVGRAITASGSASADPCRYAAGVRRSLNPDPVGWVQELDRDRAALPVSKPGIVAAASLATETITPTLARFSTSNENMAGPMTGPGPVVVVGTGVSAACEAAGIVDRGLGTGEQAARLTTTAASTSSLMITLSVLSPSSSGTKPRLGS